MHGLSVLILKQNVRMNIQELFNWLDSLVKTLCILDASNLLTDTCLVMKCLFGCLYLYDLTYIIMSIQYCDDWHSRDPHAKGTQPPWISQSPIPVSFGNKWSASHVKSCHVSNLSNWNHLYNAFIVTKFLQFFSCHWSKVFPKLVHSGCVCSFCRSWACLTQGCSGQLLCVKERQHVQTLYNFETLETFSPPCYDHTEKHWAVL